MKGQGKLSFKSLSASRNFFVAGRDGCQLSEAGVRGDLCSGARPSEGVPFFLLGRWGSRLCPSDPQRGSRAPWRGSRPAAPLGLRAPLRPRAPARAAALSARARPPPAQRPQLSRRPSALWLARRWRHKGRRGRQVARAPGGGQAAQSESDLVPPRWTGLCRAPAPEGLRAQEAK